MTNPDNTLAAPPVEGSSPEVTGDISGTLVRQPHGGALRIGNPGNKGGGRPPDQWKAMMRTLASRNATARVAKKLLENPDPEDMAVWLGAWKFAGEQGYGRAHQTISKASVSRVEFALVDERVAAPPDDGEG